MGKDEFYKVHPKTCAPDDFWGQVKRTVNGKPVSQDQIDMIVEAVLQGMNLSSDDKLLDLCCGNGALSTLLFAECQGGLGVDYSRYLIDVANTNFASTSDKYQLVDDVAAYATREPSPERFTKALCYGSFQYLSQESARSLLENLHLRFKNVQRLYLGNLPDKALLKEFYNDKDYVEGIEDDHSSPIGIWRTRKEFTHLAKATGWEAEFFRMPESFYASTYRYDVILTPLRASHVR